MTANVPYAFAFIAAQLLALPGLVLALYLYLTRRVAGSGGWLRAGFELMFSCVVLLPFVLPCLATLLSAGMSASARPRAALGRVFINIGGAAIAFMMTPPPGRRRSAGVATCRGVCGHLRLAGLARVGGLSAFR
jgi:hypothetical protein